MHHLGYCLVGMDSGKSLTIVETSYAFLSAIQGIGLNLLEFYYALRPKCITHCLFHIDLSRWQVKFGWAHQICGGTPSVVSSVCMMYAHLFA